MNQWLANQIQVLNVTVSPGPGGDYSQIVVQIQYLLIETQTQQLTMIQVS